MGYYRAEKIHTIGKGDLEPFVLSLYAASPTLDGRSVRLVPRAQKGRAVIVERTGKSHYRVTDTGRAETVRKNLGGINAVNQYLKDTAAEQTRLAL
jgi:hypothetical protein